MPTELASVRVRPLRFGFLVDPADSIILRKVLQANSCLWGGVFNFIIPIFKKTPERYREKYTRGPTASELVNGLVEAFQPDFLVETAPEIGNDVRFAPGRVIAFDALFPEDGKTERSYGIDLANICAALYDESF